MPILVQWFSQSTRQLPEGGFSAANEFGSRLIDGASATSHEYPAEATEHPVERDANITDHYRRGLRTQTFECSVSSDPSDPRLQGDDDHPQSVLDDLISLQERKVPVDVVDDRGRLYANYLITMISERRDQNTGDGISFQLMIREYRTATAQEVEAPAPSLENLRRRRDRGRQAAIDTGDGNEVSERGEERSRGEQLQSTGRALQILLGGLGGGG